MQVTENVPPYSVFTNVLFKVNRFSLQFKININYSSGSMVEPVTEKPYIAAFVFQFVHCCHFPPSRILHLLGNFMFFKSIAIARPLSFKCQLLLYVAHLRTLTRL